MAVGRFTNALVAVSGPVALGLVLLMLLLGQKANSKKHPEWRITERGSVSVTLERREDGRIQGGRDVAFARKYEKAPIVLLSRHPHWGHTITHVNNPTNRGFNIGAHVHLSIDQKLPRAPHDIVVDYVVVSAEH